MLSKYYFWMKKLKVGETEYVRSSCRLTSAFNMETGIKRLCQDIEELFLNHYGTKLVKNHHFVDLKASYDLNRVSDYVLSIRKRVDAGRMAENVKSR